MGYKEENIRHHIMATGGGVPLSRQVEAAVEADLRKLNPKEPVLPWTDQPGGRGSRGKKKAT